MNKRVLSLLMVLLVVIGCSLQPPAPSQNAEERIASLEERFNSAVTDAEKIPIAVELVLLGSAKYREFLYAEAEETLAKEELKRDGRKRDQAGRMNELDSRYAAVANRSPTLAAPKTAEIPLPLDTTVDDLTPIVALSMTAEVGDQRNGDLLRRALRSENLLMAAEAALGLAKMKEKSVIPEIVMWAETFGQPTKFGKALVYFNDATANAYAEQLIADKLLLKEVRETARARNYDPYYRGK